MHIIASIGCLVAGFLCIGAGSVEIHDRIGSKTVGGVLCISGLVTLYGGFLLIHGVG